MTGQLVGANDPRARSRSILYHRNVARPTIWVCAMAFGFGCSGTIDEGAAVANLTPSQQLALNAWLTLAEPAFVTATCVTCHDPNSMMFNAGSADGAPPYLAGSSDVGERDNVVATMPPVIDLGSPRASLVLMKGMHEGPALDANSASNILTWIQYEHEARAGSAALPTTTPYAMMDCTGGSAGSATCPINSIDLTPAGAPGTITFTEFPVADDNGQLDDTDMQALTITAGAMGLHVVHPEFGTIPAAGSGSATGTQLDALDRFFDVDMELRPERDARSRSDVVRRFRPHRSDRRAVRHAHRERLETMCRTLVLAAAVAACGDNLPAPNDALEGFVEAMPKAGIIPQVIQSGGPVLAAPIVQPIFFASATDTDTEPYVEAFLPALASSTYWPTVAAEYGVGPMTIMPSIVSTDAVPLTDADLQTYLVGQLDGAHAGWPAADTVSTIYMVMLPTGTAYSSACTTGGFAGYHSEHSKGMTTGFSFAVIANCGGDGGSASALDEVTVTISHELVEASTDPKPASAPAFQTTDAAHIAWSHEAGAELADMCEWTPSMQQRLVGNYLVQRIWSNAAATAGHDPCVPALGGPYYNSVPELGSVMLTAGNQTILTMGDSIAVGSSKEIVFDLFSDAPSDDWDISVVDAAALFGAPATLSVQYGRVSSGHNGQAIGILVRRETTAPKGGSLLFVENKPTSDDTQVPSYWWIYVQ